jgi:hypothetical protein
VAILVSDFTTIFLSRSVEDIDLISRMQAQNALHMSGLLT